MAKYVNRYSEVHCHRLERVIQRFSGVWGCLFNLPTGLRGRRVMMIAGFVLVRVTLTVIAGMMRMAVHMKHDNNNNIL